jgi:hypothetical protein
MIQVRDISQMKIISLGKVLFVLLEVIEAAILKSIQGSSIFKPLVMFV